MPTNPNTIEKIMKSFDEKFEGYWRGQAIPDEIKFFLSQALNQVRQEAYEEGLKEGEGIITPSNTDHCEYCSEFDKQDIQCGGVSSRDIRENERNELLSEIEGEMELFEEFIQPEDWTEWSNEERRRYLQGIRVGRKACLNIIHKYRDKK